ncbi:MAG: HAMP domain-containing histidine kinase [Spirochaetaceae bacterium]
MTEKKRVIIIMLIYTAITLFVVDFTIFLLYNAGFNDNEQQLVHLVQSQARLMEAIAQFEQYSDHSHDQGWKDSTIMQIIYSHETYRGFGDTGEFTLAKLEDESIIFVLSRRHDDLYIPETILLNSEYAKPMQLALLGKSGTVVGYDYRKKIVLAAYEPVSMLNLGLVAKVDLEEVRKPYIEASLIALTITIFFICLGVVVLYKISDPMLKTLRENGLQLKKINKELLDGITIRKAKEVELQIAYDKMEESSRAKSEFLDSMSHELRTPLNGIIGFSDMLNQNFGGELNDKQSQYVQDIQESGRHLLSLINDILDFSKIVSGKTELELAEFNLYELLEHSLVIVNERCIKRNISLNFNVSEDMQNIKVRVDKWRFNQIMYNLLSNAVKFTPDSGDISLDAVLKDNVVIVSVVDSGIGITEEQQKMIFEEFYQVKGGTQDKTPGTGLGLNIVKNMVELHGGKLWVVSEGEGLGSCFSFSIPLITEL